MIIGRHELPLPQPISRIILGEEEEVDMTFSMSIDVDVTHLNLRDTISVEQVEFPAGVGGRVEDGHVMAVLDQPGHPARTDHAAYLAGWCRVLRADPNVLHTVAGKAQAATDHLADLGVSDN